MSNVGEASSSSQMHGRVGAPGQDPRVAYVKKLTLSDAITSKQVKLPKAAAENFLPILNDKETCSVVAVDEEERSWTFSCTRYNCQYALSRIGPFAQAHNLAPDIFLIFYWDDNATLRVACRWELPCVLNNGLTIQLPLQNNTGRPAYGRARQQQQQYSDCALPTRSSALPRPARTLAAAQMQGGSAPAPIPGLVYRVGDQLTPLDGRARRIAVRQGAAAEASAGAWRWGDQPPQDDGGTEEEQEEGRPRRQAMSHLSEPAGYQADSITWHAQQAQIPHDQQYCLRHFQQQPLAGQRQQHPGFSPHTMPMPGFQGMPPLPYGPGSFPGVLLGHMYGQPGLAGYGSSMPEWLAFGGWPVLPVPHRPFLDQLTSPRGTKRTRHPMEARTPASPTVATAVAPAVSRLASAVQPCNLQEGGAFPAHSGGMTSSRPALRPLSLNTLADGPGLGRACLSQEGMDQPDMDSLKRQRRSGMAGNERCEGKENQIMGVGLDAIGQIAPGSSSKMHKEGCSAADSRNTPAWMAAVSVTPIPEAGAQRFAFGAAPLSVPAGVPGTSALVMPGCAGSHPEADTPACLLGPGLRLAGFSDPRAAPLGRPSASKPSTHGASVEQQGGRRDGDGVAVWTDLPEGSRAAAAVSEPEGQAMAPYNRQDETCDMQQQQNADMQQGRMDQRSGADEIEVQKCGHEDSCEAAAEALTLLASGSRPKASDGTSSRQFRVPLTSDHKSGLEEGSIEGLGSQEGRAMPANSTGVTVKSGGEEADGGDGPHPVARPTAFRPVRMPVSGFHQHIMQGLWPPPPHDIRNRASPGLPGGYYDPVQLYRGGRVWQPGTTHGLEAAGAATFAGADEPVLGGRGPIQAGPVQVSPCRQVAAPSPMLPMLPQHMHGFLLAWHHMQHMQQLAHLLPSPAGMAHAPGHLGQGRSEGSAAYARHIAEQQPAQAEAVQDAVFNAPNPGR